MEKPRFVPEWKNAPNERTGAMNDLRLNEEYGSVSKNSANPVWGGYEYAVILHGARHSAFLPEKIGCAPCARNVNLLHDAIVSN